MTIQGRYMSASADWAYFALLGVDKKRLIYRPEPHFDKWGKGSRYTWAIGGYTGLSSALPPFACVRLYAPLIDFLTRADMADMMIAQLFPIEKWLSCRGTYPIATVMPARHQ